MKKKVFLQDEPLWNIASIAEMILCFGSQIYSIVSFVYEATFGFPAYHHFGGVYFGHLIVFFFLPFFVYPDFLSKLSWFVSLDEEKVWMKGDVLAPKWFRVQLSVLVYYIDITSIEIEKSSKNSSGQFIRTWQYGAAWSVKKYLVFVTEKGKKRINVTHFTDIGIAEIIDEIVNRIERIEGTVYDGRRAFDIMLKK